MLLTKNFVIAGNSILLSSKISKNVGITLFKRKIKTITVTDNKIKG